MSKATFLIGIDLGTTNCTLAYSRLSDQESKPTLIEQYPIPQVTASGSQGESLNLPSFLFFPLVEEADELKTDFSTTSQTTACIGTFAQKRGEELPGRLVSSAKSWLCHQGVDRREPLLPLTEDEVEKISPLNAIAAILSHIKGAWDAKMDAPFDEQMLFITVPASFDPGARQLVLEAAQLAGYPEVILLEEPQAAFYAWLHKHADDWRKLLKVEDCVLVVDIGGGTTDFSLIGVSQEEGNLCLNRLAVGSHLLLGGDNIDLSLAHLAKNKLEEKGHEIDDWQMQSLVHSCRKAKELLLSNHSPEKAEITLLGRGSRLIGGSLKTSISLEEAKSLILDGFAPLVAPEERSKTEKRAGLQQLGLPYAKDARITCQLAKFLSMTGEGDSDSMETFVMPTAVLFNGGTMKAAALQNRLIEQLNLWAEKLGKPAIKILPDANYDFGVSRGAVNYGLARAGKTIRIRSGTSCSYYIGVEESAPAVPGISPPLRAICIAPFGMEEGTELKLENKEFSLVLGEMANFRFFSHATEKLQDGTLPSIGTIVRRWKQELTELHPIETLLEKGADDGKTIQITIRSKVTELGVLEVWCDAADGRKWKLEFDIRKDAVVPAGAET